MALKRKITKTDFDKLADPMKAEYKVDPANAEQYLLDVDDASELTRALDRSRADHARLKEKADADAAELAALKEAADENGVAALKKKGDLDALERTYKEQIAKEKADSKKERDALQASIAKSARDTAANALAAKLSASPAILLPHIERRLEAVYENGSTGIHVLDKDGKRSALSLADLEKEFVDNKDFASILIASKGSGGASGDTRHNTPAPFTTGSAGGNSNQRPPNLSTMKPQELVKALQAGVEARRAATNR